MAKSSFLTRTILAVMPLFFLLTYACNNANSTQPDGTSQQTTDTPTSSTTATTTNPPENILEFEDYSISITLKDLDIPTQLYVIASEDSPPPPVLAFEDGEYLPELADIDFSQCFILFAFMGFQSSTGPKIMVTQIWQIDNNIYVEALFDQGGPTQQPSWSSPADIVKVSKDNMTQYGEITFILLDQEGEERARTVGEIPE